MSFQSMTWAVAQRCEKSGQKLVLLMLANHANGHTGQCNPSHKRLADECCMSVASLKTHLSDLEAMGLIEIVRRTQEGINLPNQYVLLDPSTVAQGGGVNLEGVGQILTDGGSNSDRGVGQILATEPGRNNPGREPKALASLRSASSSPAGDDLPGVESKTEAKERRLCEVTQEAIFTYNSAPFTKARGGSLPNVSLATDARKKQVSRCIKVASAICQREFGAPEITVKFWRNYWRAVDADDFHAGRVPGGRGHESWKPDFEMLTRAEVMEKIYDRAVSESLSEASHHNGHAGAGMPR